jgi:hypothetical protein
MLHVMDGLQGLEQQRAEFAALRAGAENVSRQLGRWIESIKDSGNEGTRSRTTKARQADDDARRRADYEAYLKDVI